jgi:hypothetical protein
MSRCFRRHQRCFYVLKAPKKASKTSRLFCRKTRPKGTEPLYCITLWHVPCCCYIQMSSACSKHGLGSMGRSPANQIQSSKVTAKASRASLNVIWRAREQQGPQSKEICYLQQWKTFLVKDSDTKVSSYGILGLNMLTWERLNWPKCKWERSQFKNFNNLIYRYRYRYRPQLVLQYFWIEAYF